MMQIAHHRRALAWHGLHEKGDIARRAYALVLLDEWLDRLDAEEDRLAAALPEERS